jgi:hypothetical protein
MKKIFLTLSLFIFSIQVFALSCPDGSELVKSISADGTYFVYNCGGQESNASATNSGSSIKGIKNKSFIDTGTSSSCKDLDTNFYRKSPNKCSIIAVLDRKPKFPGGSWFKNVWQTSGLLVHRVNKNGNLEIVGKAENIQVETGEKTDRPGQMEIATIEVNTKELGSLSVQVIKNPIVEIPASAIRMVLTDINQDGLTELVIAGMLEDGRHQDSSWRDVNYIYDFETESYSKFGKPMYSHDFVAGDLDDDGYDDFIDISWGGGHQGSGIGVCNGKSLECVYQNNPTRLHTSKTSLSVYPNKKGGILFHNCDKEYLSWCWSEVNYKNGGVELKPLDKYIASKKPDKEELFNNWQGWEKKRKGWAVPGYETSERFKLISESYRSHQFDMDGDGDFDTATWKENRLCKKSSSEKVYQITSDCKPVGEMFFFRNDNGKFTVSDRHEIDPGATIALYNFDINKDGKMDFYAFRDEWNTFECNNQINNIFFGNGDGTFRRPSVEEQSEIFGNYGCEIQSYFFDFEGDSYRAFFTHKYSKNFSGSRAVYVGLEKLATKAEKAKFLAEENKSSPLFDGRYRFNLFRHNDDEGSMKIGNGFVQIRNGEVIIEKDNRELKTGSTDLYDTFSGQINEKGKVSASMTLDVLNGKDVPEAYEFNGSIQDKKIWGETAFKYSFKAFFEAFEAEFDEEQAIENEIAAFEAELALELGE